MYSGYSLSNDVCFPFIEGMAFKRMHVELVDTNFVHSLVRLRCLLDLERSPPLPIIPKGC